MNDPTRFDLDDRQRAMLAEMGVRVWWPQRSDASVPLKAPATGTATREPVVAIAPAPAPVRAQAQAQAQAQGQGQVFAPLPEGLSTMGWDELQMAVQSCQSCGLCASRQAPILGTSPGAGLGTARWMVVGDMPSEADEPSGQPFTGPEGELLDNMLKAVGVRRQGLAVDAALQAGQNAQAAHEGPAEACLTHAVKCRPSSGRNPEVAELATCAGYLSRQVALAQPQVILAMGRFAIQTLLGTTEPMGKLRGTVHRFQGVPVVVTYPPASLLRTQSDKAKAWADLVLALSVAKA
jgi:uracil-DNA glycosylase